MSQELVNAMNDLYGNVSFGGGGGGGGGGNSHPACTGLRNNQRAFSTISQTTGVAGLATFKAVPVSIGFGITSVVTGIVSSQAGRKAEKLSCK